jgi:hypothetical protein
MLWKASSVMEERPRFVARLLDGEAMTEVCRGVRDHPQDRLQDFRPLQAAGRLRQPAATAISGILPKALSTPCSIATAWSGN